MAFAIKRDKLSQDTVSTIRKMLSLMPKTANTKYSRGDIPEPITFYYLQDGIVHLPYLFSSSLLQIIPNVDISYPILKWGFTGKLLPRQVDVEAMSWKQLESYGTSTLGLYPGFGKTILGAKLASRAKL